MTTTRTRLILLLLILTMSWSPPLQADDKALLRKESAIPNVLIILDDGTAQNRNFDLDEFSLPAGGDDFVTDYTRYNTFGTPERGSKLGVLKRVLRQFIQGESGDINFGFTHYNHSNYSINGAKVAGDLLTRGIQWLYVTGDQTNGNPNPFLTATGNRELAKDAPLQFGSDAPCGFRQTVGAPESGTPAFYQWPCASFTGAFGDAGLGVVTYKANYPVGSSGATSWPLGSGKTYTLRVLSGIYGDSQLTVRVTQTAPLGPTYDLIYNRAVDPNNTDPASPFYWNGSFVNWVLGDGNRIDSNGPVDCTRALPGYFLNSTLGSPYPQVPIRKDWASAADPVNQQTSTAKLLALTRPASSIVTFDRITKRYTLTEPVANVIIATADPTGVSNQSPRGTALNRARDYFQNVVLADPSDLYKSCRSHYIIFLTFRKPGEDDCGGWCDVATTLGNLVLPDQPTRTALGLRLKGVPVFVVGLADGLTGGGGNDITCIANNSNANTPNYKKDSAIFTPNTEAELVRAFSNIFNLIKESQAFSTAAVPSVQSAGNQAIYVGSFGANKNRSIWGGSMKTFQIDPTTGFLPLITVAGQLVANEQTPADPNVLARHPNWDAGRVLGYTNPVTILTPGQPAAVVSPGVTIWPGRKIVFGVPGATPPEARNDFTVNTIASWWPTLKGYMGETDNTRTSNIIRFFRGERDTILKTTIFPDLNATVPDERSYVYADAPPYSGAPTVPAYPHKLGDIFHSDAVIMDAPNDLTLRIVNPNNYQAFAQRHAKRRRVLFVGANDGFLHGFEAGVWGRDPAHFKDPQSPAPPALPSPTGSDTYDVGTGEEIFAYAPRGVMPTFDSLLYSVGQQFTVDGALATGDMFINNGGGTAWHSVLAGGLRQGGTSVFALDVTQPDRYNPDGTVAGAKDASPACLNGGAGCPVEYPRILWEMTDSSDADANGKPDMGQTWSKPVLGRIKVLNGGTVQDQWVVLLGGGFDPAQSNSTGNAFYILDATTGKVLYKVQSGRNGTGSSVLFGSMPATAAAVDINDSGYIDIVYIGDTKGQMWKVDLRPDATATPPRGVLSGGKVSGYAPFLLFFHNDPTAPHQVFFEPTVVLVSTTSAGKKNFGIAFGSGDRENLLDPTLTNERFYFVLDDGQTTTETDADLTTITPTSPVLTSAPARGWVLRYANGNEKTTSLALVAKGFLIFTTFTPIESSLCTPIGRATRYAVFYLTGNPLPGGSRSEDLGKGAGLSQFQTVTGKGELITAAETTYQVYKLSPTKESIGSTIRNWKEQ